MQIKLVVVVVVVLPYLSYSRAMRKIAIEPRKN